MLQYRRSKIMTGEIFQTKIIVLERCKERQIKLSYQAQALHYL